MIKRILVATDFTAPSQAALAYGRELARAFDAELHLAHVVDDLSAHGLAAASVALDLSRLQAELEADAQEKLAAAATDGPIRAKGVVLTSHRAAAELVRYANDIQADLIVAGTHGRSGFADLFMGSVAQELVRAAKCPVMTLRERGHGRLAA